MHRYLEWRRKPKTIPLPIYFVITFIYFGAFTYWQGHHTHHDNTQLALASAVFPAMTYAVFMTAGLYYARERFKKITG